MSFDSLRWRVWKFKWLPHRTAEFLWVDEDGEMVLGDWKWNAPEKFRELRKAIDREMELWRW